MALRIILSIITLIILLILIVYNAKGLDIKRHKCFKIFHELYPQTKFCPGKESETLCHRCKYYTKNNNYKVDLIPNDEKEIKGFEVDE